MPILYSETHNMRHFTSQSHCPEKLSFLLKYCKFVSDNAKNAKFRDHFPRYNMLSEKTIVLNSTQTSFLTRILLSEN